MICSQQMEGWHSVAIFGYDQTLVDDLTSRFQLRKPNADGLDSVIHALSRQDECEQVVLDIATGVGKTWLLAALLEYAAASGVKNLLVVLPGKTVRTKTIANFTRGASGFIEGAEIEKAVITPQNFDQHSTTIRDKDVVKLFLMNVHHLVQQDTNDYVKPDSTTAKNLRTARPQEMLGESLLSHLTAADDLLVVLDESHRYGGSAATWTAALNLLQPVARVGLTATPAKDDRVIFEYTLHDAIAQRFVKTPVVAHRKGGYRDGEAGGQLKDAKKILERKAAAYRDYEAEHPDVRRINPIMLVTCQNTEHADEIASILRGGDMFPGSGQVLVVHSNAISDAVEEQLALVQEPDSPVRAIVQVSMLNEGWNVHNVAVLVPIRALESDTLTEQMIGRGLRLPYGQYTGDEWVDSLDILSHKSIYEALRKNGLSGHEREIPEVPTTPEKPPVPTSTGADNGSGEVSEDEVFWLTPGAADQAAAIDPTLGAVAALGGGVRAIESLLENETEVEVPRESVRLSDGKKFAFPLTTFETTPNRLELVDLNDDWHKAVAASVGTDFTEQIDRETIVVTDKYGAVRLEATTQVELFEEVVTAKDAQNSLELNLRKLSALKNGQSGGANRRYLVPFVKRFASMVDGDWTGKRIAVAVMRLKAAVNQASDEAARQMQEKPRIHELMLPKRGDYELATGRTIESQHDVTDSTKFKPRQNYDGWQRSRYSASQFDSFSAEILVAQLLDRSDQIVWWMRLEQEDGAKIEYGAGRSYYPDFVALDRDGVHWIIEGKDVRGRNDATVKAKRAAAERVLRMMEAEPGWQGSRWGYLIAYEDDVKMAHSWTNLRQMSDPRVMIE
jgi:type III restriction enzyme